MSSDDNGFFVAEERLARWRREAIEALAWLNSRKIALNGALMVFCDLGLIHALGDGQAKAFTSISVRIKRFAFTLHKVTCYAY